MTIWHSSNDLNVVHQLIVQGDLAFAVSSLPICVATLGLSVGISADDRRFPRAMILAVAVEGAIRALLRSKGTPECERRSEQ